MTRGNGIAIAVAIAGAVAAAGGAIASCAQTPQNVPVQTFENPKSVDVVCLNVRDAAGNPIIPPIPAKQSACAPVPTGVDGNSLPFHLFALVTQTSRGEVAVVDLTGGFVVDVDPALPGINFLPVGELPSDVAVAPDGVMAYVGSAAPNAPAIYAMPTSLVLGASLGPDRTDQVGAVATIPKLTSWPVCSLPQAPGPISVLPMPSAPAGYYLSVVLPGDSAHAARVEIVDPNPLVQGSGAAAGQPDAIPDGGIGPGSLAPCAHVSHFDLQPPPAGTTWTPGPTWDDGVKWVDGGVTSDVPQAATSCVTPFDAGSGDAGSPLPGLMGAPLAGAAALDLGGPSPILYVADTTLPIVHVLDLSNPLAITERAPLVATSLADPQRTVSLGQIAVSPPTREYKRYLYAIDRKEGSVAMWDVTDPVAGPRAPLRRPHPELDPFQPPDRLLFNAPVSSLAFVRHDWPITSGPSVSGNNAFTGVLCNPNPNIDRASAPQLTYADLGGYYRNNAGNQQVPLGPTRLRGIFAFITLSNGQVMTVDVDDWDAPCRRPDPLAAQGTFEAPTPDGGTPVSPLLLGQFNAVTPPQPVASGSGDFDPYHAPFTFAPGFDNDTPVSLEAYFPVSAPHRVRSSNLLRNDPNNGNHAPYVLATPQLLVNGAPVPTQGDQGASNPDLVPTDTVFVDPSLQINPTAADPATRAFAIGGAGDGGTATPAAQSLDNATPGVRIAFDDPQAHIDQDWAVTYEGVLPGFYDSNGNPLVVADVASDDGTWQTLSLSNANGGFCGKGIEDYALGQQRAASESAAMSTLGLVPPTRLDHRIADYVQLTDDILPAGDFYWSIDNACWAGFDPGLGANGAGDPRQALCSATYGSPFDPTNPSPQRDFPILAAYDGKLVIGRFGYPPGATGQTPPPREVVASDPSNVPFLKLAQCCFHNQVHFSVRTGGEWAVTGSSVGFLHHVIATGDDARCAPSCETRDALLNGRAATVPRPQQDSLLKGTILRDSPLAMRNPMFSFVVWDGGQPAKDATGQPIVADVIPVRDMTWTFSLRGQMVPLQINLGLTTIAVSPQTMRFIDSLGQLAVIDGSSQGLILVDLNTVAEAHAPYF